MMPLKRRTPLAVLGAGEITLSGRVVQYTLKWSARARYVRLEVRRETGLTVVVPRRFPLAQLPELLKGKRRWILAKLVQVENAAAPPAGGGLKDGSVVPYMGKSLRLATRPGETPGARLAGGRLLVTLGPGDGSLDSLIEQWFRLQAAVALRARVDLLGATMGVSYNQLTIRGQKSRWGSCSRKGNLSFNWKLLMMPPPVMDYVVVHELAHLAVLDHSTRFWALVAKHCPQWQAHRRWLKEHAAELAATLPR